MRSPELVRTVFVPPMADASLTSETGLELVKSLLMRELEEDCAEEAGGLSACVGVGPGENLESIGVDWKSILLVSFGICE